jgi:hypothetical protein
VTVQGVVTTLAGSGAASALDGVGTAASFSSPVGLALDATRGALYVTDAGGHKLRRIVLATAAVGTLAGSGLAGALDGPALAASLNAPFGVAVGGGGLDAPLYIADAGNNRVRRATCAPRTPLGFYRPPNASALAPCPPGTFGNASGLTSAACSGPCAAAPGSGCGAGATSPAGAPCPPGFFCRGGSEPPLPCACPGLCAGGARENPAAQWAVELLAGTLVGGTMFPATNGVGTKPSSR